MAILISVDPVQKLIPIPILLGHHYSDVNFGLLPIPIPILPGHHYFYVDFGLNCLMRDVNFLSSKIRKTKLAKNI